MGSCISKCCRPPRKKKLKEEEEGDNDMNHIVQDKLVIEIPKKPLEKPPSPAPSSSFSYSSTTKCTSTSSSSASSTASVKDRSFTNEFLWSCVKENPHIVGGLNDPKFNQKSMHEKPYKIHPQSFDQSPFLASSVVSKVQENTAAAPRKRARASSPTLVRQKSFRRDQNVTHSIPNRGLRSPSPSRRFNTVKSVPTYENPSRRQMVSKTVGGVNCGLKRESSRAPSPRRENVMMMSPGYQFDPLKRKEQVLSQRVSTKIDDGVNSGGEMKCSQEMDVLMEDINNPLIALDCFIFL